MALRDERRGEQHAAYQWLCGGVSQNHKALADFRVAHGAVLEQADRLAALQRHLDEAEASGISSCSLADIIAEARATARARGLPE